MRWIRQALPQDRPALAALYLDCRRRADWLPPASRLHDDFEADTLGELVLVELEDGGDGGGEPRPTGFVSVDVAASFIHHLYVSADCRGQGCGPRLLAALVGHMPLPWQLKCLLTNGAARRFYARGGWWPIGEEDDAVDGAYVRLALTAPPGG